MVQILVIDDDPVIQVILRTCLKEQGYNVISASNGEEGIEKAVRLRPALIICDWLLPGMDGLEVCRQVKANPLLATTFFILLTSRTTVDDRVKGLDTGADDYLAKPIEAIELKARVRAGLRLYQSAQDLQKLAQDLQTHQQILEAELVEAATYIRSLLPLPMDESVTIQSQFLPSRQLGGDCFDYFWLDPDYLAVYLLDVSGHGVGAALLSVSVQNFLRSQALSSINFYQPNRVLEALNASFQMEKHGDRYFTIWYGVYNHQKRKLCYANAGHPPAILLSHNEEKALTARRLKARGTPIGMLPDTKYVNEYHDIQADDVLCLFSDGIYEMQNESGLVWGLDRFIELLLACYTTPSSPNQVIEKVKQLTQLSAFEDDCSLLQIRFR
ncbi:MAG: SpoIIE family protein phosphatase [Elainellaceae cyanobacterium]